MKRLDITKDAHGFLKDMQVKQFRQVGQKDEKSRLEQTAQAIKQFRQVGQKVLSLLADPKPNDAAPLKGFDYRRTDVGEYRIVYRFDDETVYVVLIAKRHDDEVYKKLGQK
jgi:mRNA interferase RelE/StbE